MKGYQKSSMRIVSCNVRGLRNASKRRAIKESLKKVKANIMMLKEIELEMIDSTWVRSIWCFSNKKWAFLPSIGSSGVGGGLN